MCWDDTLNSTSPNPKLNPELKHDTNMWVDLPERVYCGRRLVSAQHPVLDADVCRCVYVCMCMCTCVSFFCVSFQMVCVCVCVCVTCVCVCVCVCVFECVASVCVSHVLHIWCACARESMCVCMCHMCVYVHIGLWEPHAVCTIVRMSVCERRGWGFTLSSLRLRVWRSGLEDLHWCQKRPTLVSKETYTSVKRDLH